LKTNQHVVVLDNFETGHQHNLDEVQSLVSLAQWNNFKFIEGNIRNLKDCESSCVDVDYILHQDALESFPRSINNPIATNDNNINGLLNMLVAGRDVKVKSFTYASSIAKSGK